jgi:hypothetical protein
VIAGYPETGTWSNTGRSRRLVYSDSTDASVTFEFDEGTYADSTIYLSNKVDETQCEGDPYKEPEPCQDFYDPWPRPWEKPLRAVNQLMPVMAELRRPPARRCHRHDNIGVRNFRARNARR